MQYGTSVCLPRSRCFRGRYSTAPLHHVVPRNINIPPSCVVNPTEKGLTVIPVGVFGVKARSLHDKRLGGDNVGVKVTVKPVRKVRDIINIFLAYRPVPVGNNLQHVLYGETMGRAVHAFSFFEFPSKVFLVMVLSSQIALLLQSTTMSMSLDNV